MDDKNHKVYSGANLEALKPWLMSFNAMVPKVNACVLHALVPESPSRDEMAQSIAAMITGAKPPPLRDLGVIICPETLRAAPTILRELADMYEDLAKLTGLESTAPAWTPKTDGA